MATPEELVHGVTQVRAAAETAIREYGVKWETKSAGSGEGEDSWSPKVVSQHLVGSEWIFTNVITQVCGAPAMERPHIDVSTPDKAAKSLAQGGAASDKALRHQHVSEGDLAKTFETRNLGTPSVQEVLEIIASHAQDHARQLRAANA